MYLSVKKDGFLFLRSALSKWRGRRGAYFSSRLVALFSFKKSNFFCFVLFAGTVLYVLHLTLVLPAFNPVTFVWLSSLLLFLLYIACHLYQGGRLRFSHFAGTMLLFNISFLSSVIWDGSWSLSRGPTKPSLSACTHHTGLSVWEHRGFGFVWFGLKTVEVEGEGGTSQELHKHEGNLNQKATVDKTGAQQVPWEMSACWSADAAGRRGGFQPLQRQGTASFLLLMLSASVIPACLRPAMSLKNLNLLMSMSSWPVCELSRKVIPGSLIEPWHDIWRDQSTECWGREAPKGAALGKWAAQPGTQKWA